VDEDEYEHSFDLRWPANDVLRVDEHDLALMVPKLRAKRDAQGTSACYGEAFWRAHHEPWTARRPKSCP
jgi:hypothetical protein